MSGREIKFRSTVVTSAAQLLYRILGLRFYRLFELAFWQALSGSLAMLAAMRRASITSAKPRSDFRSGWVFFFAGCGALNRLGRASRGRRYFEPEFAFAGRDGPVASTASDPTINGLWSSLDPDELIEGVTVRAVEMKLGTSHDTPLQ